MKKIFQMWVKCRWQHFCSHMSEEAMNWFFRNLLNPMHVCPVWNFLVFNLMWSKTLFKHKASPWGKPLPGSPRVTEAGFLHKVFGPFCDRKDKSLYAKTISVLCFPRFSPWALQQLPIVRDFEIRMGYFSSSPCLASNLQAWISLVELLSLQL